MNTYKNITESGVITTEGGKLVGLIINSHSSGTIALIDGTEPSVAADNDLTSTGALVAAFHGTTKLTSSGAMVPGVHASSILTSGGTNFLDDVKAGGVLTSDSTNVTAADTLTIGSVVYTFRAAADMNDSTDILIGADAEDTILNIMDKLRYDTNIDAVLTSTYVITVKAKKAGTDGNSIVKSESSSHLDWDGGGAIMTGGLEAETITIGSTTYTFKTSALTSAYMVKIGSTLTLSLLNLKNAINGTHPAVGYNPSTSAHESVVASASDGTTVTVVARTIGTTANSLATTETGADASWADTTLGGGGGSSVVGVVTTNALAVLGAITYTVVEELTETSGADPVAYQVEYGANEASLLDNLKAAVNGTGTEGTEYSTGTVMHEFIIATTNTNTVQTFLARTVGNTAFTAAINALATTETMASMAWEDSTFGGGTGDSVASVATNASLITINGRAYTAVIELSETSGAAAVKDQVYWITSEEVFLDNLKAAINASGTAGTEYSTGTTQNYDVVATTNTNTVQTIKARIAGTVGNAITTDESMANYAWDQGTMINGLGVPGTVICSTISFSAVATTGERFIPFYNLEFTRGLYATIGGTSADITLVIN